MRTFKFDRTTYAYHSAGAGAPLLMLHGFTGSSENWATVRPWLASFHQVITVDLPGHGRTIAPDSPDAHSVAAIGAGVAALVADVVAQPVHLLGYSMGGRLALYLALHYPAWVRSLTLESASPGLDTAAERAARCASDEALAMRIEREGIPAFVDHWEAIPLFASQAALPQSVRDRQRALRLQNRAEGLANSLRGMGTGAQPSLWPRLGEVRAATLLMTGARDGKFCAIAAQMDERLPNSRRIVVPGAGHTIHLERPQPFVRHVLNWLHDK